MRIAIVNDMIIAVEILKKIISKTLRNHTIAWVAYNGKDAVDKCKADVPDLILMDLLMPVMSGALATAEIMKKSPCPILLVTSTISGHATEVFEAMGNGAMDVVQTPPFDAIHSAEQAKDLLDKIESFEKLSPKSAQAVLEQAKIIQPAANDFPLIAIGASTGGPKALKVILSDLPQNLNASLVIIQHIDEKFSSVFTEWLGNCCKLPVSIAQERDTLKVGQVYVAGTNHHLVITRQRTFEYTKQPEESFYKPSINVFFESVAKYWENPSAAVLLTGMGSDGASGLLKLRQLGWYTIAENKTTSISYNMPRVAIEINAAVDALGNDQIGQKLCQYVKAWNGKNKR